jgi:hypothetical protein
MSSFLRKPVVALSMVGTGLALVIIGNSPLAGSFRAVGQITGNFLFIVGLTILLRRVLRG